MQKHITTLPLAMLMISGGVAIARPFVYVASFAYGAGVTKCLDSAEQALGKVGFTENTERDYDSKANDKVGRVYGSHTDSSTRAVIYCNQKEGVTSVAVSGLDADATWDLYTKLYDAEW
jgi:hypothetical protein